MKAKQYFLERLTKALGLPSVLVMAVVTAMVVKRSWRSF
jgi:hypothetical protein